MQVQENGDNNVFVSHSRTDRNDLPTVRGTMIRGISLVLYLDFILSHPYRERWLWTITPIFRFKEILYGTSFGHVLVRSLPVVQSIAYSFGLRSG